MTISSTVRIAGPFTGNGVTTTFPFTYKVFSTADVQVIRLTISTGTETTLTLVTDYNITLNGDQDSNPGGNIVLVTPLLALYTLTTTSDIANLQPTDLTNQGGFYPEVITDALDRATIQIQQISDIGDRTLKIPISDGALNMELPTAASRANSFLAFGATGLPTVVTAGSSGAPTTMTRQNFSGTGSQVAFTLASDPGALGNSAEVFIGGVYQNRTTYTIGGLTLTFSAAPVLGTDNIEFVNFLTDAIGSTSADLVTYTPAGTGAVARSAQSKMRDTVSVKDFGAVGDGVTNDTAAIQAAINTNKEVFVPNGTYLITSALAMASGQTLRGESNVYTILKVNSAINAINISDTSNVVVDNLYIQGNSVGLVAVRVGLGVATGSLHTISNCRIYEFTSHGVHLQGCAYTKISDCIIQQCSNGVYGDAPGAQAGHTNTIDRCLIINNATCNINMNQKCHYWSILNTDTYFDNAGTRTASIRLNNSHHVNIDGCTIEIIAGTCTYGILVDDSDGATSPNTTVNSITNTKFIGISTYMTYSIGIGIAGAVYNTEIDNCTALAATTDLFIGQYGYLTVVSRCLRATTGYDNPITENPFVISNTFSNVISTIPYNSPNETFSPTIQSTTGTDYVGTYTTQLGTSQVLGDFVFFTVAITVNVVTTAGGGSLVITGFPQPIAATGVIYSSVSIGRFGAIVTPLTYNINVRAGIFTQSVQAVNKTAVLFTYGASSDIAIPCSQIQAGTVIWITGFYRK